VHPVSGPPIEDGVVLMAAGRITAVGSAARVPVPAEAREVDVSGKHIYPGLIDPISQLGIFEFGAVGQATDTNETGELNPHVRAIAAVQPHGAGMNVARANGITTTLVSQASGIVQGTAGFIQLRGDTWERTAVVPEAALVVGFPAPNEAPGTRGSWEEFARSHEAWAAGASEAFEADARTRARLPQAADEPEPTLEGEGMEKLVDLFERARAYASGAPVDDDPTAPFEPNVWGGSTVLLDATVPVIRGERPVLFRANTEWQLKTLFVFLDAFPEVHAVVVGGAQAFRVADELARRDIGVIITSAYQPTPDRDDSITASYRNAGILAAAGVTVAFGTNDSADSRNLPYHAAHSAAFGLSPDQALSAVTLTAAELIGVDHLVGSLEAGKRADVIVTDGDPLQILTRVERMWIGGREVDVRDNKHDQLYEAFRARGL
jgi:imidazolonepropionase-like amidohydrolase